MIAPDQGGDASRFHDRDTRRQVQHDKEIQARILNRVRRIVRHILGRGPATDRSTARDIDS